MAESSLPNSYNVPPPPYSEESNMLRQQSLNPPQGRSVRVAEISKEPFGPCSAVTKCPNCGATVSTTTKTVPGTRTWLTCCLACFFGCNMGCCLFPFCVDALQDVNHYCPSCNVKLGVYHA